MVVVAIIGILSAVALPSYQGYIEQARQATLRSAAQSMAVRQALYRAEEGTFSSEGWSPGDEPTETGWAPSDGADAFTYAINAGSDGYAVTVTDPASGEELVVTYGNPPTAQPQQREVDSGRRRKPPAPEDEGEEEALPRLQINPFTEGEQEIFLQPPEPS
jgi:Tfp pilus assembly protein PilE